MGLRSTRALITVEERYWRGPDQHTYADGPANYNFFTGYLSAFDEVAVLARVRHVDGTSRGRARVDGPSVSVYSLPEYDGPWQYLRELPILKARAREAVAKCDAYILRVSGLVGRLVWKEIAKLGRPYAVEVVSDPWDALGPGCVRTFLRPAMRRMAVRELRRICQDAMAVHYVTREALQRRYPAGKGAHVAGFSDAQTEGIFAPTSIPTERLSKSANGQPIRIGFAGSLAQLYKGFEVLLRAAAYCRHQGLDVEIVAAGDGRYAGEMKSLATRLGIEDRTTFLGQLPFGQAMVDFLDTIDLFVMSSFHEGLPRVLVEAMARGCPCIGTTVGGIPELLAAEDTVRPRDPVALGKKIAEVASNRPRLKAMAERNFERAKQYRPEILAKARRDFYSFVRAHSRTI
jgi:glycosyltransferase involved in cell wall biosynthesis